LCTRVLLRWWSTRVLLRWWSAFADGGRSVCGVAQGAHAQLAA
jgi:hypothetical protein